VERISESMSVRGGSADTDRLNTHICGEIKGRDVCRFIDSHKKRRNKILYE